MIGMIKMNYPWLDLAKKIQAIAQAGLTYTKCDFDRERYETLREISKQIVCDFSSEDMEKIERLFASDVGYPTPKVEIRAVVFMDGKILMVREKADGKWALPGGWADVHLSPFEIAKKEVFEEAGIYVKPIRQIAILDKSKHGFDPAPHNIYQIYILCEYVDGELKAGLETYEAEFVDRNNDKELSKDRTIKECLDMAFQFYDNPQKHTICE
jgi:ADP-ribose pyrophosphatase YjhB (NUDIX family)